MVTYASTWLSESSLLWITLIHNHSIWIGSRWDDHSSIGATPLNSSIMHDVLWEVLTIKNKSD